MFKTATHPYRGLPSFQFWKRAVSTVDIGNFDPVVSAPFRIRRDERVSAAGSCFAQHIARHLAASGFNYLQVESPRTADEPLFSARYGNIYTVHQLRQLFLQAYGLFRPVDTAWRTKSGKYIDPFRPQMFPEGFDSADEVQAERTRHLLAVRKVFEESSIFIFTLGLTEAWVSTDGAALPAPPGVVAAEANADRYEFRNFTVAEMLPELSQFLSDLRLVNSSIRVILTVSPVPLVATYENRHVLVSNTYSKAALRVVAEEAARDHGFVSYFPSYEIITGPLASSEHFSSDFRSVTETGVARVMALFSKHFMVQDEAADAEAPQETPLNVKSILPSQDETMELDETTLKRLNEIHKVICEEELLEPKSAP